MAPPILPPPALLEGSLNAPVQVAEEAADLVQCEGMTVVLLAESIVVPVAAQVQGLPVLYLYYINKIFFNLVY